MLAIGGSHSQHVKATNSPLSLGPLHGLLTTWQIASWKLARGKEQVCQQRDSVISNHKMTSHHRHTPLVRSRTQAPPTLKEKGLYLQGLKYQMWGLLGGLP